MTPLNEIQISRFHSIMNFLVPTQVSSLVDDSITKIPLIPGIDSFNSLLSLVSKLILIFLIIAFNSFLICLGIHFIFSPYPEKLQNLNFYFDETGSNILSEVYFNCTKKTVNSYLQCNTLSSTKYSLILILDIANRVHTRDNNNFEIELLIHTKEKTISMQKLFFFERMELLTEIMDRFVFAPLRFLNYFKNRQIEVKLIDYYDNYYSSIMKLDVFIKSKEINLYNSDLLFKPKNNIVTTLYGLFEILILPIVFGWSIGIQLILFVVLYIIHRRFMLRKLK